MRWILLALTLVMALESAQGFPLYGESGDVKCIVFDAFENALPPEYDGVNNVTLNVDAAISGTSGAAFTMVDGKDQAYFLDENLSRELQPGRMILTFEIPRETALKGMVVEPAEGEPFVVVWDDVRKFTNGTANLRYYGIVNWQIDSDLQAVTLDVSLSNNGTDPLTLSPASFTLLDQWGWRYYCEDTFEAFELEPKTISRMGITFLDISPRSRPMILEYDYQGTSPILVDLDTVGIASRPTSAVPMEVAPSAAPSGMTPASEATATETSTPSAADTTSVATPTAEASAGVQSGALMDQETTERMKRLEDQLRGRNYMI